MLDIATRAAELRKLKGLRLSREAMTADFKENPERWAGIGKDLDVNLDIILQLASPGKDQALGHILEDMGVQMVELENTPSSTLGDLRGVNTAQDIAATAFLQRLYTIGVRQRNHPLIASFTLSPITSGSVFNPYDFTTLREEQKIQPEVDYTEFLAESMSIMSDVQRIPLYKDKPRERQHKRVTELGQIPVESFNFTDDAKAIYKYGIGIQWSYETGMLDIPMQLLGFWVMRQAITDRILFLKDLLATAIDFAHDKGKLYEIPADSASGVWTHKKVRNYEKRWRVPYMFNWMVAHPEAITDFELTRMGGDDGDQWTIGHFSQANPQMNFGGYVNARMGMQKKYVDIPDLSGEDEEDATRKFTDKDYLYLNSMEAIGQFYNTSMARDETETVMGNQSYIRYFTIGNRFYGIIPSAIEKTRLL